MLRDMLFSALWFVGLVAGITIVCRLADAGGASQWGPPDAPRHADGTPNYPAIGRAYLADEDEDQADEVDAAPDRGAYYCHVCLMVAREQDRAGSVVIVGKPRLCEEHLGRLGEWAYQQPGTLMAGLTGLRRYATRTTEEDAQ